MLALIAAKSKNNVIGFEGAMPWRQKNDLQRFKALTYSHTVIMGRKTFDSMGKALPHRDNIVMTRTKAEIPCAMVLSDLAAACEAFTKMGTPTAFIIGGEQLYREGMLRADLMYVTELDCEVQGDAFFPAIDPAVWKKVSEEKYLADDSNQYNYSFITYARIPAKVAGQGTSRAPGMV
jgi:dihydrofolate reductase